MSSLYRTSKAKHPEARPVRTNKDLNLNLPDSKGQIASGLTAAGVFVVLGIVTILVGVVDSLMFGSHTLFTTIVFVISSIFVASRTSARSPWAAWTAPVITLFLMLAITTPLGNNQFGGILTTLLLGTLLGLSDRTWVIVIVTLICWVISRRTEVKEKSRQRQLARTRRN